MKLLVTGGAGFIGSNFVRLGLKEHRDLQIVNLDALTYAGNLETISDLLDDRRHHFVRGDIRNKASLNEIFSMHKFDAVINFAAESHVDRSIDSPMAFTDTNIVGTHNLLECVRAQQNNIRFVQVSTDEVYGSLGESGLFTEETPIAPNSPYSASKASSDLMVRAYYHTFKLDVITTRCSNNYGAYQFPEKLIPLMIRNASTNQSLPVYGNGLNVRDWIHVEDHCRGVWAALTKGQAGEVYNFGANNEWTNIDIVKAILAELGKPETLIQYVKDRPGHDLRYAIDASKAARELGWNASVPFAQGLKQTIQWYMQNEAWMKNVLSGDYRNFYDRWYTQRLSPMETTL